MAMKFRKSIKVAPGVKVTLGRRSASVSVGPKGFKHSVNTRGEVHRTTSIPGTGLYDRQRIGTIGGNSHTAEQTPAAPENNPLIITDEQLASMSPGKKRCTASHAMWASLYAYSLAYCSSLPTSIFWALFFSSSGYCLSQ